MSITLFDGPDAHLRPHGRRRATSWSAVVTALTRPRVMASKGDAPGWSPATFVGDYRAKQNVELVYAVGFDVDVDGTELAELAHVLARHACVLHTTHSHRPEAPRLRAVALLSRGATVVEHDGVWAFVRDLLAAAGVRVGDAKDASRFWFMPSTPDAVLFASEVCTGAAIDVDTVMHKVTRDRLADLERRQREWTDVPRARADGYSAGALRRASEAVASATDGTRNNVLNHEAYSLARLDGVTDDQIVDALAPAASVAGLSKTEIERTIASALRARRRSGA